MRKPQEAARTVNSKRRKNFGVIPLVPSYRTDGSRQTSRQRPRASTKERYKPSRTKGFLEAGIIILVAVAASVYFYETNIGGSTSTNPPETYVSGTLTPLDWANNFTNIFFVSTTTRITYSAPVHGGSYGIRLFSGASYNVTIQLLASDGHHLCTTLPPSMYVGSTPLEEPFNCLSYAGPGV